MFSIFILARKWCSTGSLACMLSFWCFLSITIISGIRFAGSYSICCRLPANSCHRYGHYARKNHNNQEGIYHVCSGTPFCYSTSVYVTYFMNCLVNFFMLYISWGRSLNSCLAVSPFFSNRHDQLASSLGMFSSQAPAVSFLISILCRLGVFMIYSPRKAGSFPISCHLSHTISGRCSESYAL